MERSVTGKQTRGFARTILSWGRFDWLLWEWWRHYYLSPRRTASRDWGSLLVMRFASVEKHFSAFTASNTATSTQPANQPTVFKLCHIALYVTTSRVTGYLSGVSCKWFAYGPADATATLSSLASVKSRMVYLSGARLPILSWKKAVKRRPRPCRVVSESFVHFSNSVSFHWNWAYFHEPTVKHCISCGGRQSSQQNNNNSNNYKNVVLSTTIPRQQQQ